MALGKCNTGGGSGGGGKPFAMILVTHPVGVTTTCSNSFAKKDITNTLMIFYIKNPKRVVNPENPLICTVGITDGTQSEYKDVSISYEGQSISTIIDFILYLIRNGIAVSPITYAGHGHAPNSAYPSLGSPDIVLPSDSIDYVTLYGSGGGSWSYLNDDPIDISEYKYLKFTGHITSASSYYSWIASIYSKEGYFQSHLSHSTSRYNATGKNRDYTDEIMFEITNSWEDDRKRAAYVGFLIRGGKTANRIECKDLYFTKY